MISAVVLNYRTPVKTTQCVKSLFGHKNISSIIIVNNDYDDCDFDFTEIEIKKFNIIFLKTGKNLGYAKGNNFGIKFIYHNNISHDYILIINSDIIVPKTFSFSQLLSKISNDSKIAIISPKIIESKSKKIQGPYFKEYILLIFIETVLPILFLARKKIESIINKKSRYVYRTMGSFLLIDSLILKKIGLFDENTFLGCEEQILAEKLKISNKRFFYYADQFVFHNHGFSRKNQNSKLIDQFFFDSKIYYFKTYRKANFAMIELLKWSEKLRNFLNKFR